MNEFKKFAILTADDVTAISTAHVDPADATSAVASITIPGLGQLLNNGSVKNLSKRAGRAEAKEKLIATVSGLTLSAGKVVELFVNYVREGLNASEDNTRMPDRDKPLTATVTVGSSDTIATIVPKLAAVFEKAAKMAGYEIIKVSASGAVLTIEAVDCYQRLKEVKVNVYDNDLAARPVESVNLLDSSVYTSLVHGDEGLGTYKRLVKDAILPTTQNVHPFGDGAAFRGEYPVPGTLYDQVSWSVDTDRQSVAHGVISQLAVSRVYTVVYVPAASTAALIAAIKTVNGNTAEVVVA